MWVYVLEIAIIRGATAPWPPRFRRPCFPSIYKNKTEKTFSPMMPGKAEKIGGNFKQWKQWKKWQKVISRDAARRYAPGI